MKKTRKLLVSLGLAVLLVGNITTNVLAETSENSDEVIELDFWNMQWGNEQYSTLEQELINQYMEENPNVKINYTSLPWDNWYQNFAAAVASGTEPDVSGGGGYMAFMLYKEGAIMPVDDVVEEMKNDGMIDEYYNDAIEYMKYDGHYLALPWNFSLRVLIANTDLLEQAGVDSMPTNWDEFYDACKAVTENTDAYGFMLSGDNMGKQMIVGMLHSNGGGLLTEDGQNDVMSDENMEVVEFLSKMANDGLINSAGAGMTNNEVRKLFETGEVAFIFETCTYPMTLAKQYDWVTVASPLQSPNGGYGTHTGVNNIMVYNSTEHPEEAKAFALWWTRNTYELFAEGGADGVPVWNFISEEPFYQENEAYQTIIDEWLPIAKLLGNKVPNLFPELNTIDSDVRLLELSQAISLGEDVTAAMQEVSDAVDEAMGY